MHTYLSMRDLFKNITNLIDHNYTRYDMNHSHDALYGGYCLLALRANLSIIINYIPSRYEPIMFV